MGIFNKLGGVLGTQKEMNVEEWMNSEEMENVDVMSEPADFYVKPLALQQESDLAIVVKSMLEKALKKRAVVQ